MAKEQKDPFSTDTAVEDPQAFLSPEATGLPSGSDAMNFLNPAMNEEWEEESESQYVDVPDGNYCAKVQQVTRDVNPVGDMKYVFEFKITKGEFVNAKISKTVVMSQAAGFALAQTLEPLGFVHLPGTGPGTGKKKRFKFGPSSVVGLPCRIETNHYAARDGSRNPDGSIKMFCSIKNVLPADQEAKDAALAME